MADIKIYGVDDIAVVIKECGTPRRSDNPTDRRIYGTSQFAMLSFSNARDDVTLYLSSLAEVEELVERIQAALAERDERALRQSQELEEICTNKTKIKRVKCAGCKKSMPQNTPKNRDFKGRSWHYACLGNKAFTFA
tara:strand:+ start:61 stop:471 length:411 start_codon:yes stop_codon:yes gene_type:complete